MTVGFGGHQGYSRWRGHHRAQARGGENQTTKKKATGGDDWINTGLRESLGGACFGECTSDGLKCACHLRLRHAVFSVPPHQRACGKAVCQHPVRRAPASNSQIWKWGRHGELHLLAPGYVRTPNRHAGDGGHTNELFVVPPSSERVHHHFTLPW
jgi:hypothetical protein